MPVIETELTSYRNQIRRNLNNLTWQFVLPYLLSLGFAMVHGVVLLPIKYGGTE
jgi:hypothetical protein